MWRRILAPALAHLSHSARASILLSDKIWCSQNDRTFQILFSLYSSTTHTHGSRSSGNVCAWVLAVGVEARDVGHARFDSYIKNGPWFAFWLLPVISRLPSVILIRISWAAASIESLNEAITQPTEYFIDVRVHNENQYVRKNGTMMIASAIILYYASRRSTSVVFAYESIACPEMIQWPTDREKKELLRDRNHAFDWWWPSTFTVSPRKWIGAMACVGSRQLNKIRWKTVNDSVCALRAIRTQAFFCITLRFHDFRSYPDGQNATVATKERKARFSVTKLMDAFCSHTKKERIFCKAFTRCLHQNGEKVLRGDTKKKEIVTQRWRTET